MSKFVSAYFVAVDDTLTESVVGTTSASNVARQFVLFMDKTYGKDQWVLKNGYAVVKDSGLCVSPRCFGV